MAGAWMSYVMQLHSAQWTRSPEVLQSAVDLNACMRDVLVVLHICALLGVHQDAAAVPTRNRRWHATYARPAMMVHCLQMILPTQCDCLAFDGAVECLFVPIPEHAFVVTLLWLVRYSHR